MKKLVFLLSAAVLCAVVIIYLLPQSPSVNNGVTAVENIPAVVDQPQQKTDGKKSESVTITSAKTEKPETEFSAYMADFKSGSDAIYYMIGILELPDERRSEHLAWLDGITAIDDRQLIDAAEQGSPRAISLLFAYHDRAGNAEAAEYYGKRLLPLMPADVRGPVALRTTHALAANQRYDEAAVYLLYANVLGINQTFVNPVGDDDIEYWAVDAIESLAANYPDVDTEIFSVSNIVEEWRALDAQLNAEHEALFGDNPLDLVEVITSASVGN